MRGIAGVLAVSLAVVSCAGQAAPETTTAYPRTVRFDGSRTVVLHVAVAATDAQKRHGLMGVRSLPENAGMAFVWREPSEAAFWMKNTLVPLSIAFVDDAGRIVTIREMPPCRADPCPVYRSDAPFALAVEANRGWFDRHGVEVGDRATLDER